MSKIGKPSDSQDWLQRNQSRPKHERRRPRPQELSPRQRDELEFRGHWPRSQSRQCGRCARWGASEGGRRTPWRQGYGLGNKSYVSELDAPDPVPLSPGATFDPARLHINARAWPSPTQLTRLCDACLLPTFLILILIIIHNGHVWASPDRPHTSGSPSAAMGREVVCALRAAPQAPAADPRHPSRPKTIDEVSSQDNTVAVLRKSLASTNVSDAYNFLWLMEASSHAFLWSARHRQDLHHSGPCPSALWVNTFLLASGS